MPSTKDTLGRARLVCVRCHDRKVRCDVQSQPQGVCLNCQHEGCECRLHVGIRKRRQRERGQRQTERQPERDLPEGDPTTPKPSCTSPAEESITLSRLTPALTPVVEARVGFIGERSLLPQLTEMAHKVQNSSPISNPTLAIATMAGPCTLPPDSYAEALQHFYYEHLYPIVPVITPEEAQSPQASILISQAVSFAGSVMRRAHDHLPNFSPHEIYLRVKAIIALGLEQDTMVILKAYCILGCWSHSPPHVASADHPWQWVGNGLRLAVQLGLHREVVHAKFPKTSDARQIWWHLICNDSLQALCFGRPVMFKLHEFDVKPLTKEDFVVWDLPSQFSCHYTRIQANFNTLATLAGRKQDVSAQELNALFDVLEAWIAELPTGLRLFDQDGTRQPYNRWAVEAHITYFVTIVLASLLPGPHRRSPCVLNASLVASSCAARLYEKLMHHDSLNYLLSFHSWMLLVTAIPQFQASAMHSDRATRDAEVAMIVSVLSNICAKYPSATTPAERVEQLRHGGDAVLTSARQGTSLEATGLTDGHWQETPLVRILRLFDFPRSFSPRMHLVDPGSYAASEYTEDSAMQFDAMGVDRLFDWTDFTFDTIGIDDNFFSNMPPPS
ncbi:hypothetical protein F5Y18DRAFT_236214 [Xylariaceae sp. FL1019]|nr:hypothetical protein F5Y18DRAFT_236214 [Xylariaceae sp. FL1019]